MRTIVRATAVLLLAASIVGGCGDDTEADYVDGYNAAVDSMTAAGDAFTEAEDIEDFDAARTKLDEAIGAFAALTPPDDVKDAHATLLEELRATSTEADKVTETSTDAQDTAATDAAVDHLDRASTAADEIRTTLGD